MAAAEAEAEAAPSSADCPPRLSRRRSALAALFIGETGGERSLSGSAAPAAVASAALNLLRRPGGDDGEEKEERPIALRRHGGDSDDAEPPSAPDQRCQREGVVAAGAVGVDGSPSLVERWSKPRMDRRVGDAGAAPGGTLSDKVPLRECIFVGEPRLHALRSMR